MSNDPRVSSDIARPLAEALVAQLQDVCERVQIAPAARSMEAYMQYLQDPSWWRFSTVAVDAPPVQTSLF